MRLDSVTTTKHNPLRNWFFLCKWFSFVKNPLQKSDFIFLNGISDRPSHRFQDKLLINRNRKPAILLQMQWTGITRVLPPNLASSRQRCVITYLSLRGKERKIYEIHPHQVETSTQSAKIQNSEQQQHSCSGESLPIGEGSFHRMPIPQTDCSRLVHILSECWPESF